MTVRQYKFQKRTAVLFLLLALVLSMMMPSAASAAEQGKKVVRVGWHEPPYFITDESGRRSGYSYEYQRKVAAYTGWEYEYVEGSWSDLMQKLKKGQIDLMSDVSYLPERTEDMIFSSIPMGTEAYYLFVSPDNKEITADNLASLNGKHVGVAEGSIQKEYFLDWEETHGIHSDLIELSGTGEESMKLLGTELDAFVTIDVYGSQETAVPVWKIGSSDFYFVVSKNRPDLLSELDAALNPIQDENKYYDQQLHDKYLRSTETNRYLGTSERNWLAQHGTIRVGYQDNYLAFCAKDPVTGELTGALKDYLNVASTAFGNTELHFELRAFDTAADTMEALQNGEIDCMFPANLTNYDAERLHLAISPPLMRSEMDAVVRESAQKEFSVQERVDQGEKPAFAIGIFDCNNLKLITDQYGHDKGDIYLKTACRLICQIFEHSPVFRIGGDEFAVVLQNHDYDSREDLIHLFEEKRREICHAAGNKWEEVHIANGFAIYDPQLDQSVDETARRADSVMYENKRIVKAQC